MKNKVIYIYLAVIIAVVVIFLNPFGGSDQNPASNSSEEPIVNQMPDDNVHNQLKDENSMGKGGSDMGKVSDGYFKMLDSLKKNYENSPNDTAKIYAYANVLNISHRNDEAVELYNKILKINPKRFDVYFALTVSYLIKENYKMAEEVNNKVLAIDKNNAQAKYNLGFIALQKGDVHLARERWQKVVEENPGTRQAKDAAERLQGK